MIVQIKDCKRNIDQKIELEQLGYRIGVFYDAVSNNRFTYLVVNDFGNKETLDVTRLNILQDLVP